MSRGEPPGESPHSFAAELVGLEPGTSASDTVATLFRRLRDDDYLPDPLTHEALLALAGRPVAQGSLLLEEAAAADERRHFAEIERFAAKFFEIPIAERVERWKALAQASARHPRPIERLKALRPGLSIDRGALADPSATVRRLADDLLDLFPMRQEPRAAESRARAAQFRADETLTDADRSRALKDLRNHPEIVELSHGYLEQLAKPRRPSPTRRVRAKVVGFVWREPDPIRRLKLFWVVVSMVVGGPLLLLNRDSATSKLAPNGRAFTNPVFSVLASRPGSITPANLKLLHRAIRDEIKGKLRTEVAKLGKNLDESVLDRLVDALPVEQLPQEGGLATLVMIGTWTEKVHARFVARLRDGLASTDLDLDDKGRDELARKCFPRPSKGPARRPTKTP
jgi:hypothetical protein